MEKEVPTLCKGHMFPWPVREGISKILLEEWLQFYQKGIRERGTNNDGLYFPRRVRKNLLRVIISRLTSERWLDTQIRSRLWTKKKQDYMSHFDIADYNAIREDLFPITLQRGLINPVPMFQQYTLGGQDITLPVVYYMKHKVFPASVIYYHDLVTLEKDLEESLDTILDQAIPCNTRILIVNLRDNYETDNAYHLHSAITLLREVLLRCQHLVLILRCEASGILDNINQDGIVALTNLRKVRKVIIDADPRHLDTDTWLAITRAARSEDDNSKWKPNKGQICPRYPNWINLPPEEGRMIALYYANQANCYPSSHQLQSRRATVNKENQTGLAGLVRRI